MCKKSRLFLVLIIVTLIGCSGEETGNQLFNNDDSSSLSVDSDSVDEFGSDESSDSNSESVKNNDTSNVTDQDSETNESIDSDLLLDSDTAELEFVASELLGRPTDSSITLNVIFNKSVELMVEWGLEPGTYTHSLSPAVYAPKEAIEVIIDGLEANTRYYYRILYKDGSSATYIQGEEHTFHTHRPAGETFVFTIQADPHMDEESDLDVYTTALGNQLADAPDFLIDLGDTSMAGKLAFTEEEVIERNLNMRQLFGIPGHSVPLFMVMGNHEGGQYKFLDGTDDNMAVWDALTRKYFYANPIPDGFYTGDESIAEFIGPRETWYAFNWGDALFVSLDPYWDIYAEKNNFVDKNWNESLGDTQYFWLKETLENSKAKYKFIFIHNLVGGADLEGNGRGGVEAAHLYEWGGFNLDGTSGWDEARPDWPSSIHELMVDNNVSAMFHGHDHFYAYQQLDGIVYQECPQPSHNQYKAANNAEAYGYLEGIIFPNSGHLRVTVSPKETLVEYVRSFKEDIPKEGYYNQMISHSYTIDPK